jgi:hypothetical protein
MKNISNMKRGRRIIVPNSEEPPKPCTNSQD